MYYCFYADSLPPRRMRVFDQYILLGLSHGLGISHSSYIIMNFIIDCHSVPITRIKILVIIRPAVSLVIQI